MTTEINYGKVIHIEKYDASEFEKEQLPFTQICNHVIKNIQNITAAFIWIYLQSKPSTWVPCKNEIMKRFGISESTYKRHMAYLSHVRLVEYRQIRNKDGKLGKSRLVILNGTKFNESGENYRGIIFDTTAHTAPVLDIDRSIKKPLTGETARTANDLHINKDINKRKKTEINKEPPISPKGNDIEILFERFYSPYPRKDGRQDALKAFKKLKPTPEFVDMLVENIRQRMMYTSMWKDKDRQYIPHASTYLNKSRWTDEIIKDTESKNTPVIRSVDDTQLREQLKQEAIAREKKEEEAKERERKEAPAIMKKMKESLAERMAKHEAAIKESGLTRDEYHAKIVNEARMPEDNI